ncbi:hypothetical protein BD779DRAFT_1398965, partial [Infundibulicybe gibba]
MPARGTRAAPHFDAKNPRSVHGYFRDLEALFPTAGLEGIDSEMKRMAVRYLDFETAEMWECLDIYKSGTYTDFKRKVLSYYPGGNNSPRFTFGDLDALIEKTAALGIDNLNDLIEYLKKFQAITDYLRLVKQMHELELRRTFFKGFPTQLARDVNQQLRITFPQRQVEEPYSFEEIEQAARSVL